MLEVSSPTNSLVKVFRRALERGTTREGWLAVEGAFLVEEALSAPLAEVQSVLVARGASEKFQSLLERVPGSSEIAQVPDRLFERIAQTQSPQGIAALVEIPAYDLERAVKGAAPVVLVACGVQDPGNLGSMLRSALAFSASAVVTLEDTVSPWNPKAVRASAGAVFRVPIVSSLKPEPALAYLSRKVFVVAGQRSSPVSVAQADLSGPLAILIGREAAGLPPEVARHARLRLRIPIRHEVDSLNAAAAASIFLYEAARQRGFGY